MAGLRRHRKPGEDHVDREVLAEAIHRVAEHRQTKVQPLANVLDGYEELAQSRWAAWRSKQQLRNTPASFSDLLLSVTTFTDPVLQGLAQQ